MELVIAVTTDASSDPNHIVGMIESHLKAADPDASIEVELMDVTEE